MRNVSLCFSVLCLCMCICVNMSVYENVLCVCFHDGYLSVFLFLVCVCVPVIFCVIDSSNENKTGVTDSLQTSAEISCFT